MVILALIIAAIVGFGVWYFASGHSTTNVTNTTIEAPAAPSLPAAPAMPSSPAPAQ